MWPFSQQPGAFAQVRRALADHRGVEISLPRRRLAIWLAPSAATTLLAFALVATGQHLHVVELLGAAVLTAVVFGLALLVRWASLPRRVRVVPALLFLVALFLLRNSGGGLSAGTGVLAMLPIFWLALYAGRTEVLIGLVGSAVYWILPVLLIGGDAYPSSQLRVGTLSVAMTGLVGITVQALVSALAAQARNVRRIASAARAIPTAADARAEICGAARDVAGANMVFLFEPTGSGELHSTAMAGVFVEPVTIVPGNEVSATGMAFVGKRRVFARDAGSHPAINVRMWEAHGRPASMLFEPVLRGEEAVGILVVGWPQRVSDIDSAQPALIGLLAAEAATVIAQADLLDQLGRLAATDPLTGLPNRRTWDDDLDEALRTTDRDVCVAMLDLDHFKAFNDEHGHLAGDRQLKECAAAWRTHLRPGDVLARVGGEEFAVMLLDCGMVDAAAVVERIRQATPGVQTCSGGLVLRRELESAEALMARADEALYESKHAGRDRVTVVSR
jgi:diguanylate cyclase (GGDEF)-like protein